MVGHYVFTDGLLERKVGHAPGPEPLLRPTGSGPSTTDESSISRLICSAHRAVAQSIRAARAH